MEVTPNVMLLLISGFLLQSGKCNKKKKKLKRCQGQVTSDRCITGLFTFIFTPMGNLEYQINQPNKHVLRNMTTMVWKN